MSQAFLSHLTDALAQIEAEGLTKRERAIVSPQAGHIRIRADGGSREVLNLCANNYLGLADDKRWSPRQGSARRRRLRHGLGALHLRHAATSHGAGTGALRLSWQSRTRSCSPPASTPTAGCSSRCSAERTPSSPTRSTTPRSSTASGCARRKRYRYANSDMDDLEAQLKAARADGARHIMIATDGVFSMDGYIAKLPEIARAGRTIRRAGDGRRLPRHRLPGAAGPRHAASPRRRREGRHPHRHARQGARRRHRAALSPRRKPVVDMLRQRARPYLFSNALPPMVVAAGAGSARAWSRHGDDLRARLFDNAAYWRAGLADAGFTLLPGEHPIIPVMLGEAQAGAGVGHGR